MLLKERGTKYTHIYSWVDYIVGVDIGIKNDKLQVVGVFSIQFNALVMLATVENK